MLSKIWPTTWLMTIWDDQLWIGITIGSELSAAATDVEHAALTATAKEIVLSFMCFPLLRISLA